MWVAKPTRRETTQCGSARRRAIPVRYGYRGEAEWVTSRDKIIAGFDERKAAGNPTPVTSRCTSGRGPVTDMTADTRFARR
ncbi:hypothetical protein EVAR_83743_1 [Eumeta japonica]|uniref:Uncharacterized protein n=1 Tax=Eumeta variegata TaxID=151549 RepID=A0A4C1WAX7_EUMVA|nr:hypothetical protein EVAR_83743_1 [Eumeta japonica]